MTGFSVLILVVLPVVLISVATSLLPYRRTHVRVLVLATQVVVSVTLIALVRSVPAPLAVAVLGPGVVIALVRLGAVVVDRVKESQREN